jgi:hypothetical protein
VGLAGHTLGSAQLSEKIRIALMTGCKSLQKVGLRRERNQKSAFSSQKKIAQVFSNDQPGQHLKTLVLRKARVSRGGANA